MTAWVAATGLLLAVVPVAWPGHGRRWLVGGRRRLRRVLAPDARVADSRWGMALPAPGEFWRHHRIATSSLVVAVAALAAIVGGPVAAAVAGCYGMVGARAVQRRARRNHAAATRREQLDRVGSAAADLRAGLPVHAVLPAPSPAAARPATADTAEDALAVRVRAAVALAEQTGAPLAELLERIEADARADDRARGAAAAQAAGSVATAWLLAALPVGGIALGYAIGVDPLGILLHTPIGAACAGGAVALQLAGLAWSRRIVRTEPVAS